MAFGDKPTLFMASQPRALLENLQIARARVNDEPKILTQEALERWLDRQLRSFGGSWLDDTQRQVDAIADRLGWQREKTEFEALATALRGKGEGIVLISEVAKARAQGRPYDPDEISSFEIYKRDWPMRPSRNCPPLPLLNVKIELSGKPIFQIISKAQSLLSKTLKPSFSALRLAPQLKSALRTLTMSSRPIG